MKIVDFIGLRMCDH